MKSALRALIARPTFSLVAIATLGVGFAANAAIFSITRTVLLRPLPYADADRLLLIGETNQPRGVGFTPVVPANYLAWRERATSLDATAAWRFVYFSVVGTSGPAHVQGVLAESRFFSLLGTSPMVGRFFEPADATRGRDQVVVLSNGYWRREFGGDPTVVGRTLLVDRTPCTVIGILPESFKFFRVLGRELDVWRPLVLDSADREHSINLYARMRRGATTETVQAELVRLYRSLPAEPFRDGWTPNVDTLTRRFTANGRPMLAALQAAVALVLCIAAVNVATLFLALAATRRQETAVRIALGATRARLALERGREAVLIAAAAAALGIAVSVIVVNYLNASISYQDINRLEPFRVDAAVAAFVAALAFMTVFAFALLPAAASRFDNGEALKDTSHGTTSGIAHRRLRAALVVSELALSVVMLSTALQLARHAVALTSLDRGVDERALTAQVSLNDPAYDDPVRLQRFSSAVLTRLTASPGIVDASLVSYPPLSVIGTGVSVRIEGQETPPGREPVAQYWVVAPRYFATVGIRVLEGRDFDASDTRDRPGVAIVSRRFAQRFWGTADAIGRQVTPLFPPSDAFWIPRAAGGSLVVVGVAEDVREDDIPGVGDERSPQLYLPYSQNPTRILTIVARAAGAPHDAIPLIRQAVHGADPLQPTFDERTLGDVRRETFSRPREAAWLIGVFAGLALLLSGTGIYGVMAYLAAARRRELAIRVALGATRVRIVRLVVGDAMTLTGIGVLGGLALTPAASRLAAHVVTGVGAPDPAVIAFVAGLVVSVCAIAAAIPALRAARTADPRQT